MAKTEFTILRFGEGHSETIQYVGYRLISCEGIGMW